MNAIYAIISEVNSALDKLRAELNLVIAKKKEAWARKQELSAELFKYLKKE